MHPNQRYRYWTQKSYVAILEEQIEPIKAADELLPPEFCIVRTDQLKELDSVLDLQNRASLAEKKYNELLQFVEATFEKYNIRNEKIPV